MLPRLFQLGPITIYSYGLMVVLGFVAGALLSSKLAKERRLPGEFFLDAGIVILFAAVAGSRLLFVLLNLRQFSTQLFDVVAIWRGGMSFFGGLALGAAAGVFLAFRARLPLLLMADAAAPGVALGYAVGRIGCLLNGCCYGRPTTLPWGMHFPGTDPHLRYHPTQIYSSLTNLLLMALLIYAYRRPHRAGQVAALYVAGYSVYRFAIESLREGVTADLFAFGLTQAQAFCVVSLAAAGLWWLWLQRHSAPAPEPQAAGPEGAPPAASPAPAGTPG